MILRFFKYKMYKTDREWGVSQQKLQITCTQQSPFFVVNITNKRSINRLPLVVDERVYLFIRLIKVDWQKLD